MSVGSGRNVMQSGLGRGDAIRAELKTDEMDGWMDGRGEMDVWRCGMDHKSPEVGELRGRWESETGHKKKAK